LVPIPWAKRVWALPFLTALAPSERYYQDRARARMKLTDWTRQLLLQARRWLPHRRLVVVADSSFAVIELLWRMTQLANPICMVTRFRLDATLFKPAPKRKRGQKGRPRKKGARVPKLEQVLADKRTHWTRVIIRNWYGETRRRIVIVPGTAVWYHSGQPALPIRWVLIRDPKGIFKSQALLCTDLTETDGRVVRVAVAAGGHLSQSPYVSRRRNPAAMVGQNHCANDPGFARFVFADPAVRESICSAGQVAHPAGCVVHVRIGNFLGCLGSGPATPVARTGFLAVVPRSEHLKTPEDDPRAPHACSVLCHRIV
jgi:hypothetical protein